MVHPANESQRRLRQQPIRRRYSADVPVFDDTSYSAAECREQSSSRNIDTPHRSMGKSQQQKAPAERSPPRSFRVQVVDRNEKQRMTHLQPLQRDDPSRRPHQKSVGESETKVKSQKSAYPAKLGDPDTATICSRDNERFLRGIRDNSLPNHNWSLP